MRGEPTGHFVVINGYERGGGGSSSWTRSNTRPSTAGAVLDASRLINAVLLAT